MAYRDEILVDSPSIYAECEETSGTTLADSSGNGRTGTLTGGTALTADGRVGRGLLFDGVDDRVSFGTLVGTASPAFELFVKPTANPTATTQLLGVGSGTAPQARVIMFANRTLRFDLPRAATPTASTTVSGTALPLNVWTHVVALVENGSTATPIIRLLYDGVQVASATGAEALATLSGSIFAGQRDGANRIFAGYMDELAVYGNGLTVARAQAHYAARDTVAAPVQNIVGQMVVGGIAVDMHGWDVVGGTAVEL